MSSRFRFLLLGLATLSLQAQASAPGTFPPIPSHLVYAPPPFTPAHFVPVAPRWAPPPPVPFGYPNAVQPRTIPYGYVPQGYPHPAYRSGRASPATAPRPQTDSLNPAPQLTRPASSGKPKKRVAAQAPSVETQKWSETGSVRLPESLHAIKDSQERKQRFLRLLQPLVEQENRKVIEQRRKLATLLAKLEANQPLAEAEQAWLRGKARQYRVEQDPLDNIAARQEMLSKIDSVPVSLALAQAANESAWGSSRFAREGQNLFGIWTYDESKGIVPKHRAPGKTHLVRRFDDLNESVRYYLYTLNSHPAYAKLRILRAQARAWGEAPQGIELAKGLEKYSEKGQEYVRMIQEMIENHQLAAYDNITLASR